MVCVFIITSICYFVPFSLNFFQRNSLTSNCHGIFFLNLIWTSANSILLKSFLQNIYNSFFFVLSLSRNRARRHVRFVRQTENKKIKNIVRKLHTCCWKLGNHSLGTGRPWRSGWTRLIKFFEYHRRSNEKHILWDAKKIILLRVQRMKNV